MDKYNEQGALLSSDIRDESRSPGPCKRGGEEGGAKFKLQISFFWGEGVKINDIYFGNYFQNFYFFCFKINASSFTPHPKTNV